MKKFVYKNKITGAKIYTDKPITGKLGDFVLVTAMRDTQMKSQNIVQKFWTTVKGRKQNDEKNGQD